MSAIAEKALISGVGIAELNEALKEVNTVGDLLEFANKCKELPDATSAATAEAMIVARARELGDNVLVKKVFSAIRKEREYRKRVEQRGLAQSNNEVAIIQGRAEIDIDDKGQPQNTVENFYKIMTFDEVENELGWKYSNIYFNEVANCPEIHMNQIMADGTIIYDAPRRWTDADESESKHYIETNYCGLYNERKHSDALRILFEHRKYNPITDVIKETVWDGKSRIYDFLTKWTNAEDCPYTRECSRLIFAGGINRAFLPGCKLDDVIVLQGHQGDGKSSLVSWLAIHDAYYGEIKTIEGKEAVEQTMGKWVCELSELSALTKAKEVEAVKAFISRQKDNYRTPYDKHPIDRLRRCVFVGTTNNPRFLVDLTGNRRFYPVETHCNGYELYRHEEEVRDYIIQCWAEMYQLYLKHSLEAANFAKEELKEEYKKRQADATQDDWRVGAIEEYLRLKHPGDIVCVKEIMNNVISPDKEHPQNPMHKDSKDIGIIMYDMPGWVYGKYRFPEWGQQRGWKKKDLSTTVDETDPPEDDPDDDPMENSKWNAIQIPQDEELPF